MRDDLDLRARTIGQKLRNERERRRIELNDVAVALQLRKSFLVAIEEGRIDDLPNRAFTIGYVSRYARYLGLNIERLVPPLAADLTQGLDIVPVSRRRFRPAVVVFGTLLLAASIYWRDDFLATATQTYERVAAEWPALGTVTAMTDALVEQAALQFSTSPPAEIAITRSVSLSPELAFEAQEQLPPGQQLGLQNKDSRITLRVHRPTLVVVRGVRNQVFIDRMLVPGDTYRVPNSPDLLLSVEDAGAVEIMLDGKSVGFVGEPGIAASGLTLDPPSIIDRQKRA